MLFTSGRENRNQIVTERNVAALFDELRDKIPPGHLRTEPVHCPRDLSGSNCLYVCHMFGSSMVRRKCVGFSYLPSQTVTRRLRTLHMPE